MFLRNDPNAVSVRPFAEPFEWKDGLHGKHVTHVPLLVVHWRHGAKTYIDVTRRSHLERDPELCGIRHRIEAECLARRATYEVWTELEISRLQEVGSFLRAADGEERASYAAASVTGSPKRPVPPFIRSIAARLRLKDVVDVEEAWIGRDTLTGIPNVMMGGIRIDPSTRMAIWSPPLLSATPLPGSVTSLRERRRAAACARTASPRLRDSALLEGPLAQDVAR